MSKCPIYNTANACDLNPDCLFLRVGGCAIVMSATIAIENQKKIDRLEKQLRDIDYNVLSIAQLLQRQS